MNEDMNWEDDSKTTGGDSMHNPVTKRLMNRTPSPVRKSKTIYVQKKYIRAFNLMALDQKEEGGPIGPELMEEAISYIVEKYSGKPIP